MRSIRAKLTMLVVTAVASAVLLVSLISAWNDASRRITSKRLELQGIAAAIATSVAHPLANGERENVARTLTAAGRIPGVTFASVTDAEGRPVQQYGFGVVVARDVGAILANPPIGPLSTFYLPTYPIAAPIISGGQNIGQLTLIADLSELRFAALNSLSTALLAGLLAAAFGLILSRRLRRGIEQPVAALTAAMQEVSRSKDFTREVKRTSNDEIGILVDTFNGMLVEVRERDVALARHRDNLELQVMERTAELATAKHVAEAASAAKSEFLATMSHEIRTPMNGMLVMAELIASAALGPKLQRNAEVLLSSGQTLLAIINDILDFSKIEAGKLELESVPVRIRCVIDDVVKLFSARAQAQGLDIAVHVAPDVPAAIAADPVRLTQVLSNLVNNALKFTQTGSVTIYAACVGEARTQRLKLDVRDTGIGIPQDKLTSIFEAFSQADQSTTRRFGGTGIGLTICRRLVAAMGGEISVTSEVGHGSTFSVSVPIDVLEPAAPPAQSTRDDRRHIAIVMPGGATRDILAAVSTERALEPLLVLPGNLAGIPWDDLSAVIAPSADIASLLRAAAAAAGRLDEIIFVALSEIGGTHARNAEQHERADIELGLPLSSVEVSECFDILVAGRKALAGRTISENAADHAMPEISMFTSMRVLAADDNAVNREVLSEALGRLGIKVVCVEDGAAAVAATKRDRFDLVLMDCSMPVMDGFTAAREIRAAERETGRAPVPIVALTAHVVGGKADAWRDAGMSDYLTKPYTLKALRGCLEQALGRQPPTPACSATHCADQRPSTAARDVVDETQPLYDPSVLEDIAEMQQPGDDLVNRVIKLYVEHAPIALTALQSLGPDAAPSEIASAAHALKSLSCNIGALRMSALCGALEGAAAAGDVADFPTYCRALATTLPATIAALDADVAPGLSVSAGSGTGR